MNRRSFRIVSGLALLSVVGTTFACSGCPAVIDQIWQQAMQSAQASISTGISNLKQAVDRARSFNNERILSAIRVATEQIYASGDKQAATEVAAKQAAANYMVELSNRKAVIQTALEYNAATGQGYDPCGELKRSQNVAVAIGEANSDMPDRVIREIDAAPGRLSSSPAAVVSNRLSEAKSVYCTADEAKMGMCSAPGQLAGMDVDAGHFFTSYQVGTADDKAKSDMLNNLYGVPYAAPDKSVANSPKGKAFFDAKRTEDAFRSVSQASMKTLQSWTESSNGYESVLDAIDAKVGTYAGGNNYAQWEAQQTSQSEHGLLVELAKMRAFELYMRNLEYQQMERQEANLAVLLALRGRTGVDGALSSETESQAQKVR